MTDELRECVELLERLRDTYLANHQTERAVITAAIDRARAVNEKPEQEPKCEKTKKKLKS